MELVRRCVPFTILIVLKYSNVNHIIRQPSLLLLIMKFVFVAYVEIWVRREHFITCFYLINPIVSFTGP